MNHTNLNQNYYVCEKHFEKCLISKDGTRKTLFAHAVPTIFSYSLPFQTEASNSKYTIGETSSKVENVATPDLFDPLRMTGIVLI